MRCGFTRFCRFPLHCGCTRLPAYADCCILHTHCRLHTPHRTHVAVWLGSFPVLFGLVYRGWLRFHVLCRYTLRFCVTAYHCAHRLRLDLHVHTHFAGLPAGFLPDSAAVTHARHHTPAFTTFTTVYVTATVVGFAHTRFCVRLPVTAHYRYRFHGYAVYLRSYHGWLPQFGCCHVHVYRLRYLRLLRSAARSGYARFTRVYGWLRTCRLPVAGYRLRFTLRWLHIAAVYTHTRTLYTAPRAFLPCRFCHTHSFRCTAVHRFLRTAFWVVAVRFRLRSRLHMLPVTVGYHAFLPVAVTFGSYRLRFYGLHYICVRCRVYGYTHVCGSLRLPHTAFTVTHGFYTHGWLHGYLRLPHVPHTHTRTHVTRTHGLPWFTHVCV